MAFVRGFEHIRFVPREVTLPSRELRTQLVRKLPAILDRLEQLNGGSAMALVPFGSIEAGIAGKTSDTEVFAIKIGGYGNYGDGAAVIDSPRVFDGVHIEGILASRIGVTGLSNISTDFNDQGAKIDLLAIATFLVGDVFVRGEDEVRLVQLRRSELVANLIEGGEKGREIFEAVRSTYIDAMVRYVGVGESRREKRAQRLKELNITEDESTWEANRLAQYRFPTLEELSALYPLESKSKENSVAE